MIRGDQDMLTKEYLSERLGMDVSYVFQGKDGFSFCVKTELEAYKAAHVYQDLQSRIYMEKGGELWMVALIERDKR